MFQNIREFKNLENDLNHFRILKKDLYDNTNGIVWDDKNEFRKNNKLFDVVDILEDKNSNEYVIIYAINDKQEENLLKSFNTIIDELITEHTSNPKIQTIIFNLISQALPKNDFALIPVKQFFIIQNYFTSAPKSINIDPLYPPPRFV